MTRRGWRIALIGLKLSGAILAAFVLFRFPWRATFGALASAAPLVLLVALGVNLLSLIAKGWAWHLLLRRVAPSRWIVSQEANLIGCATNSISVSVVGEAARVDHVVSRDGIAPDLAVASIVWVRAVEALGLAIFMLVAPSFLRLPPILHGIQVGAGVVISAMLGIAWTGRWLGLSRLIPAPARSVVARVASIGPPASLVLPTLLALANWGAQWATYHLTLVALHIPASLASSFTALIVCNLSGLARATPGNVGIAQGAMVLALLPFGVLPHASVAAGLALQGLQVLPVLALATATVGWKALPTPASLRRRPLRGTLGS